MEKKCPHCGALLPEGAAFCPHCASDVHDRKAAKPPVPLLKKLAAAAVALCLIAAAAFAIRGLTRPYEPQVFDCAGTGEVVYTAEDGEIYQILVAWPDNRCAPAPNIYMSSIEAESDYDMSRWPSRLYVNYNESGADGWDEFSALVESYSVEVEQDERAGRELEAFEPSVRDANSPDAAMTSTLQFDGLCGEPQVVWTLNMKNGDTIRVRQTIHITLIRQLEYHWEDYPMSTIEELSATLAQIEAETDRTDEVKIYLPPVTYEGELSLTGRSYEFHGCTDGSGRTVFTDTVTVATTQTYWINFFYDIDFVGSGDEVGLSFSEIGRATDCNFTGWKTAVLCYGDSWVNVIGCTFRDNQVAFHFNSTRIGGNHTLYNDNLFENNGTAVLIEHVGCDLEMDFIGSVFRGNGTDIDNRCGHNISTEKAVFE